MNRKFATLYLIVGVTSFFAIQGFADDHPLHAEIDTCQFGEDLICTREILHKVINVSLKETDAQYKLIGGVYACGEGDFAGTYSVSIVDKKVIIDGIDSSLSVGGAHRCIGMGICHKEKYGIDMLIIRSPDKFYATAIHSECQRTIVKSR